MLLEASTLAGLPGSRGKRASKQRTSLSGLTSAGIVIVYCFIIDQQLSLLLPLSLLLACLLSLSFPTFLSFYIRKKLAQVFSFHFWQMLLLKQRNKLRLLTCLPVAAAAAYAKLSPERAKWIRQARKC